MKEYTVWVGAWEVNSCYVTAYEAQVIKERWQAEGYDDVVIEEIETTKETV
jgi:hypothetical protein